MLENHTRTLLGLLRMSDGAQHVALCNSPFLEVTAANILQSGDKDTCIISYRLEMKAKEKLLSNYPNCVIVVKMENPNSQLIPLEMQKSVKETNVNGTIKFESSKISLLSPITYYYFKVEISIWSDSNKKKKVVHLVQFSRFLNKDIPAKKVYVLDEVLE